MPRFLAPIYVKNEYVTDSETITGNETILGTTSGKDSYWDNTYIHNSLSADYGVFTNNVSAYQFYGDGSNLIGVYGTDNQKLPLSGGRIDGDLVINGGVTALSGANFVNTIFTTTSALSIINVGYGPALYVYQTPGTGDIASFVDGDGIEALHIGNDGKIGIKSSSPNKELTVTGDISATGDIFGNKFYGDGSNLTNLSGTDSAKLPLSGGSLTGELTGTVGIFTTSLSSPSINGSFYGDGSGLINVSDVNKLPLSGGSLTGELTGTVGLFTTSLSSVAISGTFYGDGSKLTGITGGGGGTDNTKLPLSGGVLTGALTGTNATFTSSISSPSISGTFYGDVSNSTKGAHYFVTCRTATNQTGTMDTGVTPNTFTYTGTGALPSIDGVTPIVGDTILFGGQTTSTQAGPWKVINAGSIGVQAVLERPSFFSGTVKFGMFFTISKGTSFQGNTYAMFPSPAGITDITVGTSNVFFGICFTKGANNATNSANTFVGTQTLAAGSTTTAPLKFQSGVLLSTPTINTIEWDGNFMYLTTSGSNSARTTNVAFVSAPATSSSFGLSGQVAYDSNYFYVCTAPNTWVKTSLNSSGNSIDNTKLPLSGGTLTGTLTGTVGIFTTSISALNLSGTFYGDGSKLSNITSNDNTKLPLSGGLLTGSLTGTNGIFTVSLSAPNLSGTFYGDGSKLTGVTGLDNTKLSKTGGRIDGDLVINGGLTALSGANFVNTIFTTTSALSIVNTGYGPALYVYQAPGIGDVASFYDGDGIEVLHVGNGGKVGINVSLPTEALTVSGSISASGDIWATKFRGDGSLLTGIVGTDSTKLPLSGGNLTGSLTGTVGVFTTSLSSVSISGTHYGDGSKLTGLASAFLPLSGGTLTGGLSAPSISGTFYGDGSNIYNIPSQINFIFDGGGSAVQLNSTGIVQIPYNIKIVSWTLLANSPSNTIVQVLTSSYAAHPTYTVISGLTNTPSLINATKATSTTMSDFVTAIPADSYLQFTVTSNDAATNLTLSLKCLRTS